MTSTAPPVFRPFSGKSSIMSYRPASAKSSPATNALVRINKKGNVPDITFQTLGADEKFAVNSEKEVHLNDPAMKKVLGELYKDIKYLQQLKQNVEKETKVTDLKIGCIADTGLKFLQDRGEYWDKLGPLPPLVVKKRSKYASGFKSSLDSLNTQSSRTTLRSNVTLSRPPRKKKDDKSPEPVLQFKFSSYQPSLRPPLQVRLNPLVRIEELTTDVPNSNPEQGKKLLQAEGERKTQVAEYFKKTFEDIRKDFQKEYFETCEKRIEECLACLKNITEDTLEKKKELEVKLYNTSGDLMFKLGYCEKAVENYHHALERTSLMRELRLHTLGNIGRVYTHKGEYSKALEIFTEQSRIARTDSEVAMVFLSLGQCFLSLRQYENANECGQKALLASRKNRNLKFQIESLVLLAISLARLSKSDQATGKINKARKILRKIGTDFLKNLVNSAENMVKEIIKYHKQTALFRRQKEFTLFPQLTFHHGASLVGTSV